MMSLHSSEQYPDREVQLISDGVPKITLKCAEQTCRGNDQERLAFAISEG